MKWLLIYRKRIDPMQIEPDIVCKEFNSELDLLVWGGEVGTFYKGRGSYLIVHGDIQGGVSDVYVRIETLRKKQSEEERKKQAQDADRKEVKKQKRIDRVKKEIPTPLHSG